MDKQSLEMLPPLAYAQRRATPCRLLKLPAEIREQIWIFAVTEWSPMKNGADGSLCGRREPTLLQKCPIRLDRFNRPLPPAITRTCLQIEDEALPLYYSENVFECWRPLLFRDWSQSTFIDWLLNLGPEKRGWLNDVVLLYKHESELEQDLEDSLAELGIEIKSGVISNRQELSEYEMSYEQLGLPRHFGKNRRWDRWLAGSAGNNS